MARTIKLLSNGLGQDVTLYPDLVPFQPDSTRAAARIPLILYIYRVPGRKDVFLTRTKIPNESPTDLDVNECIYYLRYDDSRPPNLTENIKPSSWHTSSESASRETRNSSQLSLVDRGVYTSQGTQMTLVGVDLGNECIQEVATMLDARSSGAFLNRRRSSSSSQGPTADDSLYVDIHTDSYKAFGQDVAYMGGKAFTRRMFKRDVQTGSFSFLNPWQGQVSMQNQNHVHDTIKSFHTPSGNNFGGSLVSELRCNFSSVPKSAHQLEVYDRRHSLQSETVRKITRGLPRKGLDSLHSSTSHRWSATSLSSGILQQPSVPYPGMELAQERLGGGRGDEAKLAKLILYPGGHDFIDLLVAANLLVFNRIYEHAMQRL